MNISGVVIMNHWKRKQEGEAQLKLVGRDCARLGIDTQLSYDDGSLNVLKNLCQALRKPVKQDTGWRLIIHDDLLVPVSSIEKLDYILGFMPKMVIVSAYCPSNNGYDNAFESGHHILQTSTNIWGQALAFPEKMIPKFLGFVDEFVKPDYPYDDRALSAFLQTKNMKCHCIIPSLFQHLGSYRSTLGFPGKVGKRYRFSEHFDPNFDPRAVDWKHEINNFASNETRVVLKEILKA